MSEVLASSPAVPCGCVSGAGGLRDVLNTAISAVSGDTSQNSSEASALCY